MNLLLWLETNSVTGWMLTTNWVYPWTISLHSIGMGFLVGVIFVIALRVLGVGRYSVAALERFLLIVRVAFGVSLATGILLFVLDAERFFFSPTFRIKLLLIVLGGITGLVLSKMVFRNGAVSTDAGVMPLAPRLIAAASLVCWVGAIVAGRMTAYLP